MHALLWALALAPPPPLAPAPLPPCTGGLAALSSPPAPVGESLRYHVQVDGLNVGRVDFKVERLGTLRGSQVRDYRSQFKIDPLVAALVPLEGRAASLVADGALAPSTSMSRYHIAGTAIEEDLTWAAAGREVTIDRRKGGTPQREHRTFALHGQDFVAGFYLLRRLPPAGSTCTLLVGNERLYTVWVEPDVKLGEVPTPVGPRPARRYAVRYATDRSPRIVAGEVWLADDGDRIPYRLTLLGRRRVEADLQRYERTKPAKSGPSSL